MRAFFLLLALSAPGIALAQFNKLELVNVAGVVNSLDMQTVDISVDKSELKSSESWITVKWQNVLDPQESDWIGVYTAPLDLAKSAPIKYQFANLSSTHVSEGKGEIKMNMINMRHEVVFVFFTNGLQHPIAIAASDSVKFANPNEPLQAHLALGKESTIMKVTWTTKDVGSPIARWGFDAQNLTFSAPAKTTTYKREEMCGSPANSTGWMDPGVFHTVEMTNLVPDARYFYEYGSEEFGFGSGSFVAPPKTGADSTAKFFAFGDMGQVEIDNTLEQAFMVASINTTELMRRDLDEGEDFRLVVHIGDISYARGHSSQWDQFFDQIDRSVAKSMPWMTLPGNHERDWPESGSVYQGTDSGGECGVAYGRRFQMPLSSDNEDDMWYSFDFGPVHFVMISTEHPFAKGTKQHEWVEKDLEAVDRTVTPWVVFAGHRPMYIDSIWHDNAASDLPVARDLTAAFESLIIKHKVDLAIWGHHHSYQRTCSVAHKICIPKHADGSNRAPVHMVIGMAGYASSTGIHKFRPPYFKVVDIENHGYTRGIANGTHLTMEFVSDRTGDILDSVTLVKGRD